MDLNLTNLKDLEYICEFALAYYERRMGTIKEIEWLERIAKYRQLFQAEIARLEAQKPANLFGHPDPGHEEPDAKA